MTMNRCSILLAVLLAVPAAAARAEDGDAAEQVKRLDVLAWLAGARGDSQEAMLSLTSPIPPAAER
jgi:hypothetical protein